MGLTKPRAAQIYNLDYKQATRVVAVTNITLSGGAPATVDGVSLNLNNRVLVTAQSTGSQNGIYLVTTVGSGSNGTWVRTTDANDTGEVEAGMIIMVTEGAIYADTQWKLITDDPIVIDTTALTFTQNYSANSITGGTSNVTVYSNANVTISSAGTANVLIVSSTGTVVKGTESVSGNITVGNVLTGGLISATGNITGNYILGNGSQLTGLPATYGNSNVTSLLAAFGSNTISTSGTVTSGNITGSNILTGGLISASGTITGTSHLGAVVSVTGAVTAASVVGGVITGSSTSVTGTQTAASTVGGVITGTSTSVTGNTTAGNILTGGLISATGNITGGNIISTGTSGNITGANVISATTFSATGNITGGNILTAGQVSTVGNLYLGTGNAGYVYGNGTYLTGISAAISVSKIENGNSNVWVQTAGGDVTVTAGGVSNVAVFSTGSMTLQGAFGTPKTITSNIVVAGGINAMLIGPMVFGNGYNLTVPTSSTVYIYAP